MCRWFLCLRLPRRLYNIPPIPTVESTKANQMIQVKQAFCTALFIIAVVLLTVAAFHAQTLPSEAPQELKPTNYGLEYERRDVMIPMRDGVKLHTVIIVPKSVIESKKH